MSLRVSVQRVIPLSVLIGVVAVTVSFSQTTGSLFAPGDRLEIVRRFNYTLRESGRYKGHVERETRTWLTGGSGGAYRGELMVSENMIHDFRTVAARIETRETVELKFDGERLTRVSGAPVWQGLPTVPAGRSGAGAGGVSGEPEAASAGTGPAGSVSSATVGSTSGPAGSDSNGTASPAGEDRAGQAVPAGPESETGAATGDARAGRFIPAQPWEAGAVARVQLPDGTVWSVPTAVRYEPQGVEEYQGQQVVRVAFGYMLQWPLSPMTLEAHPAAGLFDQSELPDRRVRIRANHQGAFLLPESGGVPVLHRTNIQEQLVGTDGTTQERTGFILTWYRSTPPTDDLVVRLQEQKIPEVEVDRDELDRVRLSIRNLQFVADQAVLLPGERGRLDDIAELLESVPKTEILVTGHTADVGTQESQMVLSIERAKKIVDELVERGIGPGQLRYEGKGGTEPVGDNSTEEGRAANRRVELRLLSE